MTNKIKRSVILAAAIIFFADAEAQKINDIDPGGLITYQLTLSAYSKYEKEDRARLKANKVKEVYINGDTNFPAQRMMFDREGRMTECIYNHFAKGTSHVYIVYDSLGRGIQYANQIEGKQRFESNVFYGELYPEYIISSGDSVKPVRYDVNYKSARPKSFVNNNYKDGTISFIYEYIGNNIRINMDVNSISSRLMDIISTDDSLIFSIGSLKLRHLYGNGSLEQIITEKDSEFFSNEEYYRKPAGIIDYAIKTRAGCPPLKCEFQYIYYED